MAMSNNTLVNPCNDCLLNGKCDTVVLQHCTYRIAYLQKLSNAKWKAKKEAEETKKSKKTKQSE